MFGGCDNGTACFDSSINTVCNEDDKNGLIDTCIPELSDFSALTFGNGTYGKGNFCYLILKYLSQCMRFPTMSYVRSAEPQIILRIRVV